MTQVMNSIRASSFSEAANSAAWLTDSDDSLTGGKDSSFLECVSLFLTAAAHVVAIAMVIIMV